MIYLSFRGILGNVACCIAWVRIVCALRTSDSWETSSKRTPTFPSNYKVSYTFSYPFSGTFLPEALAYPVTLWVNAEEHMLRMDVYDGLDTELHRDGHVYVHTPVIDKYACFVADDYSDTAVNWATPYTLHPPAVAAAASLHGKADPGAEQPRGAPFKGGLPDLSKWKYEGHVDFEGHPAEKWSWEHKVELRTSRYQLYLSPGGVPLFLHMLGAEIRTGAHFDEWEMRFTAFEALDGEDTRAFALPAPCGPGAARPMGAGAGQPLSLLFGRLIPILGGFSTEYDEFMREQRAGQGRGGDRHVRALWFHRHSAFVRQHNLRTERTYTMALNRFADWSDVEYGALLGYRRQAGAGGVRGERTAARSGRRYKKTGRPLPEALDWRGSGAVGAVKDQGVCGSCWTFSASGVMAAAWWMATGRSVSLSEQQVLDCSWRYGYDHACNGGDPDLGVQYIIDAGGAFTEADYPYQGVNDFCEQNRTARSATPGARMSEILYIDEYDEPAVREALLEKGPLSIGLDATAMGFRFYSSGVLHTDDCGSGHETIDHAVLLVGYGTSKEGMPYYVLKNEWSGYWGDGGFIKVSRDKDCGISAEAFAVVADAGDRRGSDTA